MGFDLSSRSASLIRDWIKGGVSARGLRLVNSAVADSFTAGTGAGVLVWGVAWLVGCWANWETVLGRV